MTRVLFIAGTGRSGSTLLGRMLAGVAGLDFHGELCEIDLALTERQLCSCGIEVRCCSFWEQALTRAFGDPFDPVVAEFAELKRRFCRHRSIPLMLAPRRSGAGEGLRRFRDLLGRLYGAVVRDEDGSMLVDASKYFPYAAALRGGEGIDVRFVHLVRDPRGVAYSYRKSVLRTDAAGLRLMSQRSAPNAALYWSVENSMFAFASRFGWPLLRLRYEDLVTNPGTEVARILEFIELRRPSNPQSWTEVDAQSRDGHIVSGNPMKFQSSPVETAVDDAWLSGLTAREATVVRVLTWPVRKALGY